MADNPRPTVMSGKSLVVLLASLAAFLILLPLIERLTVGRIVFRVAATCIFFVALLPHRRNTRLFRGGVILFVCATLLTWERLFFEYNVAIAIAQSILAALLLGTSAILILIAVVSQPTPKYDIITGVVIAYLLLGISWAFLYLSIAIGDLGAFQFPHYVQPEIDGIPSFSSWTYFSFVTMSTLGYGDFTPVHPMAQTLAWMQSVGGQFYFAILVARFVGMVPRRTNG